MTAFAVHSASVVPALRVQRELCPQGLAEVDGLHLPVPTISPLTSPAQGGQLADGDSPVRVQASARASLGSGSAAGSVPRVRPVVSPEEISGRVAGVVAPAGATPAPDRPHESDGLRARSFSTTKKPCDASPSQAPTGNVQDRVPREDHLRAGAARVALVLRARELVASGRSWAEIGTELGVIPSTIFRWVQRVETIPCPTATDLADRTWRNGSQPTVPDLTGAEMDTVRALLLRTNRTRDTGSITEALLQAMEGGAIRPPMAELIRSRMAAGQVPLTARQMHRLAISRATVRAYRAPRGAWLERVSSGGALQVDVDPETGDLAHIPPGARWTIDDGSINLLVIVPGLEIPGDKCWEQWGVVVGRFQLLLTVDHRTRCIIGRSYTCRPRDAYRAEDLSSALHTCIRHHGAPREIVMEKGISAAALITRTLGALGVTIVRANSPHQKVVESVFNVLWTSLSTLPGQVGRTRGEMERMSRWQQACHEGRRDPRGELMTLPDFLTALDAAIARCNHRWVDGRQGRWQPQPWFERSAPAALRRVADDDLWMFTPHITEPLRVDFHKVTTSVQLIPGRSERFEFGAPWLPDYDGARVCLHFDPCAEDCEATAVLAQDYGDRRAGTVLGRLQQQDRYTAYTRRALGYGLDVDPGTGNVSAAARRLVADVRAVGAVETEVRSQKSEVRMETSPSRASRGASSSPLPQRLPTSNPTPAPREAYVDPLLSEFEDDSISDRQ